MMRRDHGWNPIAKRFCVGEGRAEAIEGSASCYATGSALTLARAALYKFVQRRSRPRKIQPEVELPSEPEQTDQPVPPKRHTKLSPEEIAQQRALIQDLRSKPVVVREVRKRFAYDPDEPLILEKHKQES
jgi:hypothetical protein